ncbi:PREDICTED: ligand-dependent nuclear receptor-interacting factor 1-like [Tinamus guttatus]|uniref:ligand-dependent nuclear receptor-interacting factor 1-like n=1 Tax=Tinamus guttatus TaxID=94827 RepID=UPI00052E99C0|nr:PREDICTED: ligand-dependent nuclear receptor-interacting factor 1-like [Tinamus guttatus]
MTSATRQKLSSRGLNGQSNEAAAGNISLERYPLLTRFDQDQVPLSGITELLNVTKKPQGPFFKYDLEIPPQAKIVSVPLSSLPLKIQQLISARAKNVSDIRQATEIPSVTYVWPVIKMKHPSKSFLTILPKSLKPTSPNLAKQSFEDVQCSQISPVKQHAQEELLKTRSCPLIVKSSNSIVSVILKSLTNPKNKDLKNMLPLSSLSPIGNRDKVDIPLFKDNALMIHNGRVFFLYVTRDEVVSSRMEIHSRDMLLRKTAVHVITCRAIHDITSKFFNQTAYPPEKDLQKNGKKAHQEKDSELRKKFGIVKDVRVCLKRINPAEFMEDSAQQLALLMRAKLQSCSRLVASQRQRGRSAGAASCPCPGALWSDTGFSVNQMDIVFFTVSHSAGSLLDQGSAALPQEYRQQQSHVSVPLKAGGSQTPCLHG